MLTKKGNLLQKCCKNGEDFLVTCGFSCNGSLWDNVRPQLNKIFHKEVAVLRVSNIKNLQV